ncbi:hypothetical protein K438DRAFT_1773603 [Mycena galopus ATCC 62051]|nr:hypothetical protein K438DRAFT_1773603 [Mycena galopus ATCC 62051]
MGMGILQAVAGGVTLQPEGSIYLIWPEPAKTEAKDNSTTHKTRDAELYGIITRVPDRCALWTHIGPLGSRRLSNSDYTKVAFRLQNEKDQISSRDRSTLKTPPMERGFTGASRSQGYQVGVQAPNHEGTVFEPRRGTAARVERLWRRGTWVEDRVESSKS